MRLAVECRAASKAVTVGHGRAGRQGIALQKCKAFQVGRARRLGTQGKADMQLQGRLNRQAGQCRQGKAGRAGRQTRQAVHAGKARHA